MTKLSTHINQDGNVMMVDVSEKNITDREAIAVGELWLGKDLTAKIKENSKTKKGDVFSVAIVAGIMAAKKTSELIPLCHQIPLTKVELDYVVGEESVTVTSIVKTNAVTGVEMEALVSVNICLLTIYDMLKSQSKAMEIRNVKLLKKSGGKSGDYQHA